MWERRGRRQGGVGTLLYLDPRASYMGFRICENSTVTHLRFLLFTEFKLYCNSEKLKIRWEREIFIITLDCIM